MKWHNISMDFVVGLTKTSKGGDLIWISMDILIKSTHFILIKINYLLKRLAEIDINEIMRLHGIPSCIVSEI